MSDNRLQSNENVQQVSVKLESREFCTESTRKVSKFEGEVGHVGSGRDGGSKLSGHHENGVTLSLTKSDEQSCNTAQFSPASFAELNNDACRLMDFCTNIRVDENVGLKEDISTDTESGGESDMSDETEYETAEDMAQAGAPVPSAVPSLTLVAKSKPFPKTPGAKWSRHTYVNSGSGPPVPLEKIQFLEKCEPGQTLKSSSKSALSASPTDNGTSTDMCENYNLVVLPENPNCPVKFKKILPKLPEPTTTQPSPSETESSTGSGLPKPVATSISALELANFCTNMPNIKVESTDTMSKTSKPSENIALNPPSTSVVTTSQSQQSSAAQLRVSTLLSGSTMSTRNIVSLPRPPNKFQYHWMNVYHWLEYDTEKHAMFCNMCKRLRKMNPFATVRGCTNFKTCTLKRHEQSNEHKYAIMHYAKNNQIVIVDGQSPTPSVSEGQVVRPDNSGIGAVSHIQFGGCVTPIVVNQSGKKRDAQGKVVETSSKSLSVNNVQMGKSVSGVQYKIIPQTITSANSGGAPVMIHKLVPTNQTAADQPQPQPRNYNGFRMAYYIAKEQLPIKSVENVIALVNYPPYHSWKESMREHMFNDLHHCIASTIWKAIQFQLLNVNFISLTLEDGGVDKQGGFHWLLVSAKYVHQNKLCSYLVHLDKLHEMSVEELMLVVAEWLLKNRIPFHKLVGLEVGSDKDGLITNLLPHVIHDLSRQGCKLVSVHTSGGPQLSLAVSEVSQRIPALQRYNDFVGMMFDYFDGATDRTVEIPLLQEHLNEQTEEVMNYSSMMWLSRADTIRVIYLVWAALVEALQAEEDEEAQDLLHVIKQYTFIALTHFLMDFLPAIHALDDIVKKEPWNTSAISSTADYAIASVEALQDHLGAHEQQFFAQFDEATSCFSSIPLLNHQAQQQEVADVRNEFLQVFLIELQGRYPRGFDTRVKDAFHALHPKVLREIKDINSLGLPQVGLITQALGGTTQGGGEEFKWISDQALKQSTAESSAAFYLELLPLIRRPLRAGCIMNIMKMIECFLVLPGYEPKSLSDRNKAVSSLEDVLKIGYGKGGAVTRDRQIMSRLCIIMNGPPIDRFNYESAYMQWLKLHPGQGQQRYSKVKGL